MNEKENTNSTAKPLENSSSTPTKTVELVLETAKVVEIEPTIGQHEVYGVFFRMLKMGVPRPAVEQKMKRDGFLIEVLELGANAPISKLHELESRMTKSIGEDEVYRKYFKMLKMGVPKDAVKQRMERDGFPTFVIDLDETAPLSKLEELKRQHECLSNQNSKKLKPIIKKNRTIRWDAIPEERLKKGSTIWHHEENYEVQFNNELENLFIAPTIESVEPGKPKSSDILNTPKKKKTSVLDARRAQSICIGIAKLKISAIEFAKALNDLDEIVLTSKVVQVVQGCNLLPTQEEYHSIRKLEGNFEALSEADLFLYQLGTDCPDASVRIEALTFRYLFDEIANEAKEDANRIILACEQVRSSAKLKDLLRIVLLVGNQINSRGEDENEKIRAFTLASLLKLSQTKSVNKTITVLEYIVGFLLNKMPQVFDVFGDLEAVNLAKRVDLQVLTKQVRELRKGFEGILNSKLSFDSFCSEATKQLEEVERCLSISQSSFHSVLDYFGEDDKMTSVAFFTILQSFLVSLDQTRRDLIEKQKRNARKLSIQSKSLVTPKKNPSRNGTMKDSSIVEQVIPDVLATKRSENVLQPITPQASHQDARIDVQTSQYPHLAEFLKNLA